MAIQMAIQMHRSNTDSAGCLDWFQGGPDGTGFWENSGGISWDSLSLISRLFADFWGFNPFQCAPPGYFEHFRSVFERILGWSLISFPTVATDLPVQGSCPCHLGSMSEPIVSEKSLGTHLLYLSLIKKHHPDIDIENPHAASRCYCMANLNPVSSTDGSPGGLHLPT